MSPVRESAELLGAWLREGRRVARALLVEVEGSAPLPPGASMLVDDRGGIEGSITGGCVESAVAQEAVAVLRGGPPRLLTYGISDELAGTVGLSCGGTVHVFVHELTDEAREVELAALEAIEERRPVAVATLLDGDRAGAELAVVEGRALGSLGGPPLLDYSVARDAEALLDEGRTTIRRFGAGGETHGVELRVHVRSFASPPQMVIFGAIDFSAALARIAAEVEVAWPQEALAERRLGPRDAVLVFTHDPKLDQPALLAALETGAGYIGALGSRRTTAARNRRLLEAGVDESSLARLRAPCGLDIGSATPEEVAVSIVAEIIALRSGRAGAPLRATEGPIHAPRSA